MSLPKKTNSTSSAGFTLRSAKQSRAERGFTLIELLIVVAIIAILTAIGASSFTTAQRKGRDTQRKTDLKSIQSELEKYYSDGNLYPTNPSPGGSSFTCADSTPVNWTNTSSAFRCDVVSGGTNLKTYLGAMPRDPSSSAGWLQYCYITTSDQAYTIYAKLELAPASSDPNYQNPATTVCNSSSGFNFKVTPST